MSYDESFDSEPHEDIDSLIEVLQKVRAKHGNMRVISEEYGGPVSFAVDVEYQELRIA